MKVICILRPIVNMTEPARFGNYISKPQAVAQRNRALLALRLLIRCDVHVTLGSLLRCCFEE